MATTAEERELAELEHEIKDLEHTLHKDEAEKNRKRQKRRRKKQQSIAEDIFKLSALLIGLVLLVVFCIHDGAYDDFDVGRSASYHSYDASQGDFVARYMTYVGSTQGGGGAGKASYEVTGKEYAGAADLGITYNGAPAFDGLLTTSVNSPTKELTEYAFVVNLQEAVMPMYTAVGDIDKQLGLITDSEYADYMDAASENISGWVQKGVFSQESYYKDMPPRNVDALRGAVGPAILNRYFYSSGDWKDSDAINRHTWDMLSDSNNCVVDLMLVKNADVEKYLVGDAVDVTYVQYHVVDVKAHSVPWGLCQTYIYEGGGQYATWPVAYGNGLSNASAGRQPKTDDIVGDLVALHRQINNTNAKQYWWPHTTKSAAKDEVVSGYGNPWYSGVTAKFMETGTNAAGLEFINRYSGDYSCVGVLVYADKPGNTGGGA